MEHKSIMVNRQIVVLFRDGRAMSVLVGPKHSIQHSAMTKQRNALLVVCAYNEAGTLPMLLDAVGNQDVLVVDDGSIDGTSKLVTESGAVLLIHPRRLGKSVSLQDALDYANTNGYKTVLEIGADAVPAPNAVNALLNALVPDEVGGASAWQIPLGPRNVAYFIDEVIWSLLNHGKRAQQGLSGSCHTGGVMYSFKIGYASRVSGAINDDEQLCIMLRDRGLKTVLVENAVVYFDASSSIGHIIQRRRRMITGHLTYSRSTAPSMDFAALGIAVLSSLREKPRRLLWIVPAIALEAVSRLLAWRDTRIPAALDRSRHWVTTYAKNRNLHPFNSTNR